MTGRTNAAGGVRLPELSNPAGAAQILSGYEAINADGEAMVGTLVVKEPVYGIYNDPAQYVDISNSGDVLSSLKITLPTPIAKVLGLGIMFYADGYRCLMSYPATDSTRNDAPYLSEPDEEALWGVYFMELSGGSIAASFCTGKLSVSGSTITITSRSQQASPIPAIESIYQMAYMYLPT